MKMAFLDMDDAIEKSQNRSVAKIFEEDGEDAFRRLEHDLLQSLKNQNYIVSTGGGAPCFNNNMDTMLEDGCVVFIDLPAKALVSRLKGEQDKRPLLKGFSEQNLLDKIEHGLQQRIKTYQRAHILFNPLKENESVLLEAIQNFSK